MIKNKIKILILSIVIAIIPTSAFSSVGNLNSKKNKQVFNEKSDKYVVSAVSDNSKKCINENCNKEDYTYEKMVNEYTFLSQDEKELLININKETEDIYNEINKIYNSVDNSGNKSLSKEDKSKIINYEKEINNLQQNIKDINKKIRLNTNKDIVYGYTFLTETEKKLLLETYNILDNLYEEKNELFHGNIYEELTSKEKDKVKEYDNKILDLEKQIKDIKRKINMAENEKMVNEYTFLTEKERERLIKGYNEINDLYLDMNELYFFTSKENSENLKEFQNKIDIIRNSIKDLNRKIRIHYDKEFVQSYKNLTSDEKNTILQIYNQIYEIEDKIDSIRSGKDELSSEDEKKVDDLTFQINNFYEKVYAIEEKGIIN